ncbi:MAG: hypothetical protein CMM58_09790 [Rhodospirillaceae bacterium]|nr:hypothetical protein [Rhodospirillaceae bacterium]|tara:strand:+ start:3073 stop:3846 length:774 start_codon:yes stop_codon:yes gene_type:complete
MIKDNNSPSYDRSLEDGLSILNSFKGANAPLSPDEISAQTGLEAFKVQSLCSFLTKLGYLNSNENKNLYSPTGKLIELASGYYRVDSLFEIALPFLTKLSNQVGESTSLLTCSSLEITNVFNINGGNFKFLPPFPGEQYNMAYSAAGRAILAQLPAMDVVSFIFSVERKLLTRKTITEPKDIIAEIEVAKLKEFSVIDGEVQIDQISVGSPILGKNSHPVAAVEVGAPRSNWKWVKDREKLGDLVAKTAAAITDNLS